MKLWKKAAAAVLAAVMSLTLLTGCSGGGGSVSIGNLAGGTNGADVGTEDADVLIKWTQECAQEQGLTLTKDDELTEAMKVLCEYNSKMAEAEAKNDTELVIKLTEEYGAKLQQLKEGRECDFIVGISGDPTNQFFEGTFKAGMRDHLSNVVKQFENKPTKIGCAVYLNEEGARGFWLVLSDK